MTYCSKCGRWRKIVAFFRCRECLDEYYEEAQ